MSKLWRIAPFMEKRMGALIDKAIIVLKALIVFLELIRMFF
ncbi:damage-inducible type I toxin DinQ [Enterobacter hormaechei]